MLIAVITTYVILIFPIFINLKVYVSGKEEKIFFNLCLFGFINILFGFVEFDDGILLQLKRKRIKIKLNSLLDIRKKAKPLRDYHFLKINIFMELGSNESLIVPLISGFIENYTVQIYRWLIINKKPYFEINNKVLVVENEKKIEIYTDALVVLNILMVLLSVIKIIVEKVKNGKQKQNKRRN